MNWIDELKGVGSFRKEQPVDVIGSGYAYLKSGYLVTGMEIKWPGMFTLFEEEIEQYLLAPLDRFMLGLPAGTVVHYQNVYEKGLCRVSDYNPEEFLEQTQKNLFQHRIVKKHRSFLFIAYPSSYSPADYTLGQEGAFLRQEKRTKQKIGELEITEKIENTQRLADTLNSSGVVVARMMNQKDIVTYAGAYVTLSFFDKKTAGTSAIADEKSFLCIGDKKLAFISLKHNPAVPFTEYSYPNYTSDFTKPEEGFKNKMPASFMHILNLGLDVDHITNMVMIIHDTGRLKKKLLKKIKDLKGIGRPFDKNEKRGEALENFLVSTSDQSDDRLVSYSFNVGLIAHDNNMMKEGISLVERAFEKLSLPYQKENFHNKELFFGNFLGNGYTLPRQLLSSLKRANRLIPYETHGVFSDKGLLVETKTGNPTFLDFCSLSTTFNNRLVSKTNYNFLLFGKTGSGKSSFLGYLIKYLLDNNHHIVLIDKGNSFQKLGLVLQELYPTKIYRWTDDAPLAFNPFIIDKREDGTYDYSTDNINYITQLLLGAVEKSFEEKELGLLRDLFQDFLLKDFYDKINEKIKSKKKIIPNFNLFYHHMGIQYKALEKKKEQGENMSNEEAALLEKLPYNELVVVFKKFVTGGIYQNLFNAESSINLEQDQFVLFELDRIQKDPYLFSVVSICIAQIVNEKFKSSKLKDVLKYFLIDEGTFMLNTFMAEVIAGLFQTARKHGAGVGFTDQTFDKLVSTGHANRLCGNSDTVIILEQKFTEKTIEYLQAYAEFTSEGIKKIKAINNSGKWREGVIKVNNAIANFRLTLSPEYFLLLNTDYSNSTNKALMAYFDKTKNIYFSIKEALEKENEQ